MLKSSIQKAGTIYNTGSSFFSEFFVSHGGNDLFFKFAILAGVLLIQLFFPKGTRTISRRMFLDNLYSLQNSLFAIPGLALGIDKKYLREYRCQTCQKLLAKGQLKHKEDVLEVKCRGCSNICLFSGEDAEIIKKRSVLLKQGLIPDTEVSGIK